MNIGEVERLAGLPAKTIRYYEEIGLIRPRREANGYRRFAETDLHKRRELVHEIDGRLLADGARPPIAWKLGATCTQPQVKGYASMVNSIYNGFRFEEVWLDRAQATVAAHLLRRPTASRVMHSRFGQYACATPTVARNTRHGTITR